MLKPLFMTKVYFLHRLQPNTKCIIFVNRIVTARSLSHILRNLKFLSAWKCGFLVGVHAGLVSRGNTNIILEKFRSGEVTFSFLMRFPPTIKFERTVCYLELVFPFSVHCDLVSMTPIVLVL